MLSSLPVHRLSIDVALCRRDVLQIANRKIFNRFCSFVTFELCDGLLTQFRLKFERREGVAAILCLDVHKEREKIRKVLMRTAISRRCHRLGEIRLVSRQNKTFAQSSHRTVDRQILSKLSMESTEQ